MTRFVRLTGALAAAAILLTPAIVDAQTSCASVSNPVVVAGSPAFDAVISQYILATASASPPPVTFVYPGYSSPLLASCPGVENLVAAKDLEGMPGRYYTASGGTLLSNDCVFAAGQTLDLAISEVFYETCANAPQPRPADVMDVLGPVQPAILIVPNWSISVQYLTRDELRSFYGCGVSIGAPIAGFFNDPSGVWCRTPTIAGAQVAVARNLGLTEAVLTKKCTNQFPSDQTLATAVAAVPPPGVVNNVNVLAYVGGGDFNANNTHALAFRAANQTQAFYPDSKPMVTDRANVRDGHYPLWGYGHLVTRTTGGQPKAAISDLIAWLNGVKTIPNVDLMQVTARAGLIPSCAMKVQRSTDGGLLRPYAPAASCSCAFTAISTRSIPAGCVPCLSPTSCGCGTTCQHGFCE